MELLCWWKQIKFRISLQGLSVFNLRRQWFVGLLSVCTLNSSASQAWPIYAQARCVFSALCTRVAGTGVSAGDVALQVIVWCLWAQAREGHKGAWGTSVSRNVISASVRAAQACCRLAMWRGCAAGYCMDVCGRKRARGTSVSQSVIDASAQGAQACREACDASVSQAQACLCIGRCGASAQLAGACRHAVCLWFGRAEVQ